MAWSSKQRRQMDAYRAAMGEAAAERQKAGAKDIRGCCGTRIGSPHHGACRYRNRHRP